MLDGDRQREQTGLLERLHLIVRQHPAGVAGTGIGGECRGQLGRRRQGLVGVGDPGGPSGGADGHGEDAKESLRRAFPPTADRSPVGLSEILSTQRCRKRARLSSSSSHQVELGTGPIVPVQGEANDLSRYPVMLSSLSCSQVTKCCRTSSRSKAW